MFSYYICNHEVHMEIEMYGRWRGFFTRHVLRGMNGFWTRYLCVPIFHANQKSSCPIIPLLATPWCIYCGIGGTHRTLNTSVKYYPKCTNCHDQLNVPRRKMFKMTLTIKRKRNRMYFRTLFLCTFVSSLVTYDCCLHVLRYKRLSNVLEYVSFVLRVFHFIEVKK